MGEYPYSSRQYIAAGMRSVVVRAISYTGAYSIRVLLKTNKLRVAVLTPCSCPVFWGTHRYLHCRHGRLVSPETGLPGESQLSSFEALTAEVTLLCNGRATFSIPCWYLQ